MHKMASSYDDALVLDQLKYLGMLEIIRIRREGYPIHFPVEDFVRRYKILGKYRTFKPAKEVARYYNFYVEGFFLSKNIHYLIIT